MNDTDTFISIPNEAPPFSMEELERTCAEIEAMDDVQHEIIHNRPGFAVGVHHIRMNPLIPEGHVYAVWYETNRVPFGIRKMERLL